VIFAGIDIGSTTTKAVLVDESKKILTFSLIDTSFDRNRSGEEVLQRALEEASCMEDDIGYIASTGYGRRSFQRAQKVMPEIFCHGKGTLHLMPDVRTIIDIGGQDSKIIEIDDAGIIKNFEMNDKCAAGTGRFLEVLTQRLLNISLDELGPLSLKAEDPCVISSVCTIFAESEIISFLSTGRRKEDIACGMHNSIAKRIISMGHGAHVSFEDPVIFTGGGARNIGLVKSFEGLLQKSIVNIEHPQSTAALGVALFAKETYEKEHR
jgi:predicted CoA-substrate-specific enzyme activase